MKTILDVLIRLYGWSLHLYPVSFRMTFAAEMAEVFQSGLQDTSQDGNSAIFAFCLREVWEFPPSLIHQYWVQLTNQELIMATNPSTTQPIPARAVSMPAHPKPNTASIVAVPSSLSGNTYQKKAGISSAPIIFYACLGV